ncbi:Mn-containing catalase-like protein [Trichormus variabilis ATCC 29413]|uniref:Mn-containing catalase-like protein n=1 Tax=Trichormus variabilis (strain ATCC 29413 / PCC 7937) TaxID=240292 RepID=Q3MG93_TRIV2|nr:Mn-containing catalase-like protein [Trichormus variabilis ATCC 29413]
MFYHAKKLQYFRPPEKPDAVYANKIQELIGGTFGEMTVMMQYLLSVLANLKVYLCKYSQGFARTQ